MSLGLRIPIRGSSFHRNDVRFPASQLSSDLLPRCFFELEFQIADQVLAVVIGGLLTWLFYF
jgi:hypothetical protein